MKKKILIPLLAFFILLMGAFAAALGIKLSFPTPYREVVLAQPIEASLAYAVMKAESGFREDARSRAGAVGLMQLKPSTAEFICQIEQLPFSAERLTDGAYNIGLGCRYLKYLLERFSVQETALAAYNAGEGTVRGWLKNADYSADGLTLLEIPYSETRAYVKKVIKFKKIYEFMDG